MTPFTRLLRREFLKLAGASTLLGPPVAEGAVLRLFQSLTAEQAGRLVFPFEHPLRSVSFNNWRVVEPRIADLTRPQQSLCREILEGLCSPEGLIKLDRAMGEDGGGFAKYHVAIFGEPGKGPAQWVLTGRHVTIRADAVTGLAGRGPIFLGHSAEGDANAWRGPGRRAEAIFRSLDPAFRPDVAGKQGFALKARDGARKQEVQDLVRELLGPFRGGGIPGFEGEDVTLTYFGDRATWRLESPGFAWHYHARPHVHSWLTVQG